MSTKTMKILTMLATILLFISISISTVFAANGTLITPNQLNATYNNVSGISDIGGKVMGIVNTFGVVVAVVVLMVLGIKYMMGSAEEKAEYKKTMMPYVIGAVLIFAATTIANAIYNFAKGI